MARLLRSLLCIPQFNGRTLGEMIQMKTCYLMTTVLTVAVLNLFSARAACGGGGWSKATSTPNAPAPLSISAEVVDLGESAQVMSIKAGPLRTFALDSSAFDKRSLNMDLTTGQRSDISSAKTQIQNRMATLKNNYETVQTALMKCTGHCDAEGKNLERATMELKNFDPNKSFAEHLNRILMPSQLAQLDSKDIKKSTQGI